MSGDLGAFPVGSGSGGGVVSCGEGLAGLGEGEGEGDGEGDELVLELLQPASMAVSITIISRIDKIRFIFSPFVPLSVILQQPCCFDTC